MKIAALCNSLMGIPSLQSLARSGRLAALGIPAVEHDATITLRELAPQLKVPLTVFTKQSFAATTDDWLRESGADVVFVYTFPWLVSTALLSFSSLGFLNFHFGLLPQYRGADAIFWEIRNREPYGAVTVHKMEASLDTGPVAIQQTVPIRPVDTYGIHMAKLAMAGMQVTKELIKILDGASGTINWEKQDESKAREWPKPGQRDVVIDWPNMYAHEIIALVRACNPWNKGAYTFFGNQALRITVALDTSLPANGNSPGTLMSHPQVGMAAACRDNQSILLESVYLESGFFSGKELPSLGIMPGMQFSTPPF
jgi:methionyl-tRNA formyltransferase